MAQPNEEQIRYWSEDAGPRWVAAQELSDVMLAPFGAAALEALAPQEGESILDIGAGCGDSTLHLARKVGARGRVLAVDIAEPMLRRAGDRAREAGLSQVDVLVADIQSGPLGGTHDGAYSRFGIMFFDGPVAAFRSLRASLRRDARLAACTWRSREENAWLAGAARAAAAFVDLGTSPDPHAPGPFGLFDSARTRGILEAAGWHDVGVRPFDADVHVGGAKTAEEAAEFALRIGPAAAALAGASGDTRRQVQDALRDFFAPHAGARGVVMPGAAWIVTARA